MTKQENLINSLRMIKQQLNTLETDIESLRYESVCRLEDAIQNATDGCGYALENVLNLIATLEGDDD